MKSMICSHLIQSYTFKTQYSIRVFLSSPNDATVQHHNYPFLLRASVTKSHGPLSQYSSNLPYSLDYHISTHSPPENEATVTLKYLCSLCQVSSVSPCSLLPCSVSYIWAFVQVILSALDILSSCPQLVNVYLLLRVLFKYQVNNNKVIFSGHLQRFEQVWSPQVHVFEYIVHRK